MRSSNLVACIALACVAACGRIHVKSVRVDGVPADLEGEWQGSWHSSQMNAQGSVTMRLQEFHGEPVVSIHIDNPCIAPRDYSFTATGSTIELLADGEPVFSAELAEGRILVGTYHCHADAGAWNAAWQQELPGLLDLTGDWQGTLTAHEWLGEGVQEQPLFLRLDQFVRNGALGLAASLSLPGVSNTPVHLTGAVLLRENAFDLELATLPEVTPAVRMTGTGRDDPLTIEVGMLEILSDPTLPPGQALWTAVWQR